MTWNPWKLRRLLKASQAENKALRVECNLHQRRIGRLHVTLDGYELAEKGGKS